VTGKHDPTLADMLKEIEKRNRKEMAKRYAKNKGVK